MKQKSGLFFGFICFISTAISATPVFAQAQLLPVTIHGAAYFSIGALSHETGFPVQWDPILKNATVTTPEGEVKFHVGSEFILSQKGFEKLSEKVAYLQGEVMLPWSANRYFEQVPPRAVSFAPTHQIKRVVIDAGHGGYDLGAMSSGGIKEKELALKVSKLVADELKFTGVEVVMTREKDVFVPLPERSKIANEKQTDLFISIHANASPTKNLKGFEVYYLSESADDLMVALEHADSVSSLGTARTVQPTKELKAIYLDLEAYENRKESIRAAEAIADKVQKSITVAARRVKSAGFHVLKWTQCPSILIEIGYLTNSEDELKLVDSTYQRRLAQAIVKGFMNYKAEFEQTNGFTP